MSSLKPTFFLILLVFFCSSFLLLEGAEQRKFERVDYRKGLSQNHITVIHQDKRGFMWFGTSDGLVCYDGYEFISFRYDPRDSTSISGNYIFAIFEDSFGKMWVRTSGGGLNCYDPDIQVFRRFYKGVPSENGLSDNDVTVLYEDRQKRLWIGTKGGGLNRFQRDKRAFQSYRARSEELSGDLVSAIIQDSKNRLWVGTSGNGISRAVLPDTLTSGSDLSLTFRQYGSSREAYLPQLSARINDLLKERKPIVSQLHPGNNIGERILFKLEEATVVMVISMGEGAAFVMNDYGFIRDMEENSIWKMQREQSTHAGGSRLNRLQIDVLELEKGEYQLGYISNSRHSFGNWEETPPDNPLLWGIQILPITPTEAAFISEIIDRRDASGALPPGWITSIHEDKSGGIWIATTNGLATYQEKGNKPFTVYNTEGGEGQRLSSNFIRGIWEDPSPGSFHLWLLMDNGSLSRLNYRSGRVQQHNYSTESSLSRSGLSGPDANQLLFDDRGTLWVGTERNGLNELTLRHPVYGVPFGKPRFNHYRRQPNDDRSISDNEITALYEDRSGLLWIGTRRGGLNKINLTADKFRYYSSTESTGGLTHPVVTSIVQDANRRIWVGTLGGGLNLFEKIKGEPVKFRHRFIRADTTDDQALGSDLITCLLEDQSGFLWIGTSGAGLYRMDPVSNVFKSYRYDPETTNSLSSDDINTIYEDQYGQIWIGTSRGLNQMDGFRETFKRYIADPDQPGNLSSNEVLSIAEDKYSNGRTLWIGTRSGGLNIFDRKTERFTLFHTESSVSSALHKSSILAILQDVSGDTWFGTNGSGLFRFDRLQEKLQFFTEKDGLANNSVRAILEDLDGYLWLSTNVGISRFDIKSGEFRNYDISDGLQSNEFNPGAAYKAANGEMFFGGINGFNAFLPDSVKDNSHIPPIVVAEFKINDSSAREKLHGSRLQNKPLRLNYNENNFSIEFAALDFTNPDKNLFRQILTDDDGDTLSTVDGRKTSYPGLEPGNYHLHVRASNNDGVWNNVGFKLDIVVSPPWWQTAWFRFLLFFLTIAAAVGYYKYRVRYKLRLEQVRMQENERVRAKAAHDFHDELGHKLTKINLFSELVQRNPSVTPDVKDYLMRISENTKGLSGGMRDFIWTLDPDKDSLHEVAVRLKDFGDELFDKTGIAFRVAGMTEKMEQAHLTTDWRRHLVLIFKEAMNNALKHADCKNVTLNLELKNRYIEVVLNDDGQGLPEEMLVSANGRESNGLVEQGSGNGLRNMQMRADKLGGSISVFPSSDGTTVKFRGKMPQTGN